MNFLKGTLAVALTGLLTACGGGSYYGDTPTTGSSPETPATSTTEQQKFLEDHIKREGSILFGLLNNNDPLTPKGYIDHALDTFGNGVLDLAVNVHKEFIELGENEATQKGFFYLPDCHANDTENTETPDTTEPTTTETTIKQGCYVITGNNIRDLLGDAYTGWKFKVIAEDLKNLQPKEGLEQYIGQTSVIIYENQNKDKNLNNIVVTGKFSYPYRQSWGLDQDTQIRFVTIPDADGTNGGFNIYNDPTSTDGKFYVVQADSSYSVLTNDNPNTPNIEPVTFTVHSTPGTQISSFRIKEDGTQVLDLPSVTAISGQRLENEAPATNAKSIGGSIFIEGKNVLNFLQSQTGSTISYKHVLTVDADGKTATGTLSGTITKK